VVQAQALSHALQKEKQVSHRGQSPIAPATAASSPLHQTGFGPGSEAMAHAIRRSSAARMVSNCPTDWPASLSRFWAAAGSMV